MLSKKAKYGLKAMFYLAKKYGKGPILISDLAEEENIPKKFLELILLDMKRQGLLVSKMGKGGGYELGKHPDKIICLLYTSPSPRDRTRSRMPSSA